MKACSVRYEYSEFTRMMLKEAACTDDTYAVFLLLFLKSSLHLVFTVLI